MREQIEDKRLKEICKQLLKVIRLLCNLRGKDVTETLNIYTNLSTKEIDTLNQ